ncbi:unnamed protein product [Closterium sp. NIES-65]|nr:unnamed protein product [Closterium sp. NIES-65]
MATVRRIIPHTERGKATRHNYVNMYAEAGTLETGSDDEFMPTVLYGGLQSPGNAVTPGGSTLPNDGADAEEDDEPIPAHILNNDWSWLEFGDDGSEDGASADVEEVPQKGARVDSGSNNDASRVATLEAELRALMGKVAQLSGQVVKRQEEPEGQTGQNVEKPAVAIVESQPPVPVVTKPAATPSRKPQVAATVRADHESPDNPASKGTSGVRKDRQRLSDMKDAPHLPPNPLMYDPLLESPITQPESREDDGDRPSTLDARPLKRMLFSNPLESLLRTELPPRQDDLGSGGSHGMGRTDEPILDRQGNTHGRNMSSQHYEEGPWRFGGKRGRGDESVIIVVDYDPEERVPGLPRSMPKPKPFRAYAKHAMELQLRHTTAWAVTYFPKNSVRNEALLLALRRHYDVVAIDIKVAMDDTAYSGVVGNVWTKFRNESSTDARHYIYRVLRIDARSSGKYKMALTPKAKKYIWGKIGQSKTHDVDFGLQNMRDNTVHLSGSPLEMERCMETATELVWEVVQMWLRLARGQWYDPRVRAYRWGDKGLYINESGLEEFRPECFAGTRAADSGDASPWIIRR